MGVITDFLTLDAAEAMVCTGSDIVVIPYASRRDADDTVHLTVYTEMVAQAAAALYKRAATDSTAIVAVGEHTNGLDMPSTTDVVYDFLAAHGVPRQALTATHPRQANATPQQIAWLARTYGAQWSSRPPVLVGHSQHGPRIAYLCKLFQLPARFVDARTVLRAAGTLTPAYDQAVDLYDAHNVAYERTAFRLTRAVAWLGPAVTLRLFQLFTWLRTPNVVDVVGIGPGAQFYAHPARAHNRTLTTAKKS